jgi:hypothetical protein
MKLIWSIGLYTIDLVIVDGELAELPADPPSLFSDGSLSDFLMKEFDYSARLENGIFKIYAGLDVKDLMFARGVVQQISNQFDLKPIRIGDVGFVKAGGTTISDLTRRYHDSKGF